VKSVKNPTSIMRRKDVESKTGLKRSTLYELMQRGRFPKPISIGPRAVGWIENEVESWIEEKILESRGKNK
jgi:prophage regulatory protein